MVGVADVKFYKSMATGSTGGAINTAAQISSGSFNNLFSNIPRSEQDVGEDYYLCMYCKNTHASENMEQFNFWIGTDTIPPDTTVKWGFDSSALAGTGYRWSPGFTSTGSNTDETADSTALQLATFTLSGWFKTTTAPSPDEGWIINKGGTGSEAAGENLNYGLWMDNTGRIKGGFETGAGTDNFVTSTATYHNGTYHFALVYYNGSVLKLFVDNMDDGAEVASLTTSSTPETNTKPVRINQNSRASNGWFPSGAILDEIRVWNRALTDEDERTALFENNIVNQTGLVLEKSFGVDDAVLVAQTIANIYTEPTNVTWQAASGEPAVQNVGQLKAGKAFPIWVWWHVEPEAISRADDAVFFNFSFVIPGGGTGDSGGSTGGGGSMTVDPFGIRQIYATKSGGRTWYSNWHTATSHELVGTPSQSFGNTDPQDSMVDLVCPDHTKMVIDDASNTMTADTTENKNSLRLYIKDAADTQSSSTWKWSESMEITVYYKAISDFSGGSFHVHCRLMGPTEHWLAINTCGGAGHEYSYEIKKNLVNQFRKEEFHVEPDSGYAENIEFSDRRAPYNEWVGMKLVTKKLNSTTMYLEAWKDLTDGVNGGTWIKQEDMTDDGTNWKLQRQDDYNVYTGLPTGTGNCVKIPTVDQALTMTASAFGLRVDNTKVQFKKFSGREIEPTDPGTGGSGGSSGGGGGTGGGGGGNPPPTNTDYRVALAGDWGCENTTNDVIDLINSQGYDFVVGVGDNAYESASCWTSRFTALKNAGKLNSAYGNHEYSESGGINPYKTFFGHSKTYFSFRFQNIFFVVADTNIDLDPGSTQHDELTQQIQAVANDSTIKWKIFVCHHPWFGASSNHGNNEFQQVQAFHQLLMQHKFAFVVVGHNHNWQRTKQVAYNASSPTNPTVVASTSPYTNTTAGLIHVVSGAGGHDSSGGLYSLGSQPSFQAYQNRTHNGVWELLATNNGLTLTCSFREIGGDVFDTFVINST